MTERRSWTQEQDRALKYLKDVLKVKKWSEISKRLEFQYNLPGRNGKQCRESFRYTNHLDSSIVTKEFTSEDEQKLFALHDKIGNKWSLICKQFTGRTDNHIKNHFHSKLRKGIRKLNKEIKQNFKKTIKQFKLSIIYKIVEASDYRFTKKILFYGLPLESFNQLKNFLLQYAGGIVEKSQLSSLSSKDQALFLIQKLQFFEKFIKNKKILDRCENNNTHPSQNQVIQKIVEVDPTFQSNIESSKQNENQRESQQKEYFFDDEEDESFQYIIPLHNIIQSPKSMEEQTASSGQEEILFNGKINNKEKTFDEKGFYSFQNHQIHQKGQISKQKNTNLLLNIPESLIGIEQFPSIRMSKKFSTSSFESLKQYGDSMNDSELHLLIKRFDSYSDIEAGLFE